MQIVDVLLFESTFPDLIRLTIIPLFVYLSWKDIRTRTVENKYWVPLLVVGAVLLFWEGVVAYNSPSWRYFWLSSISSVFFFIPLMYVFWYMGAFGGADAKAFMAIALFIPSYPTYYLESIAVPVTNGLNVFAFAVLTNAGIIAMFSLLFIFCYNVYQKNIAKPMFIGVKTPVHDAIDSHGQLLESDTGLTMGGVQLSTIKKYLEWREATLEELQQDPDCYRHPETVSTITNKDNQGIQHDETEVKDIEGARDGDVSSEDWWGVDKFLSTSEYTIHDSSTPEEIREGIERLINGGDVWVAPGTPFIAYITIGLVFAFVYGNVIFYITV